MLTTKLGFIK